MKDILYINSVEDIRLVDMLRVLKEHDYSKDYLTFEALEDGTIKFLYNNIREDADDDELFELITEGIDLDNNYIEYSTDNGNSWIKLTQVNWDSATIVVSKGDKVLARGVNNTFYVDSNSYYNTFSFLLGTSHVKVYGNIKTIYGEQGLEPNCFLWLFGGYGIQNKSELLVNALYLVLPYTTLASNCYFNMFTNCTSLVNAPELPATILAEHCYFYMFNNCRSLTTAPALPATTLSTRCYESMFYNCTSLITPPVLPATMLANYCYISMFGGCISLTTAPLLPATTLASGCYNSMFYGCTALTKAPVLSATTLANGCYQYMFSGTNVLPDCTNIDFTSQTVVASGGLRGLFGGTKVTYNDLNNILPTNDDNKPCLPVTTLAQYCYEGMFAGCASLTTAPELPAITLASGCYNMMFEDCKALTTAPELPATTLAEGCYFLMFYGCTRLNYIKAMFTTTPSSTYTSNWVNGVSTEGTFVKNSAATWNVTGNNGIPSGWAVETATE